MLPAVRAWSADGHHSLREISKEDVLLALPPGGNERVLAAKALRTLFSVLKARGLVFVNPTAAIPTGRHERRQPLPLDVQVLRASLDSGDPARAALTALVAFHGLRAGELRGLKLTDASSGHLYVSTRRIVLADPVRVRLSSYLDYRNAKWPSTANPHFFVNHLTACRTDPVGSRWLSLKLGMPAQLIREDRILDEALATEGDLRRLCDLFGIGIDAASRYSVGVDPASIEDPRTTRRIRSE
jgi:integrase